MEGSWVRGESPKSFRQRLTKTHGQVRSLANFSSSGREEEGEKKKSPRCQELLSSKQGKMNSLLESSRTFLNLLSLASSFPSPPLLLSGSEERRRQRRIPGETRAAPGETAPCRTARPEQVGGKRSPRSSRRREPVPPKDTGINRSQGCSRPRELPLPAAEASALAPARSQAHTRSRLRESCSGRPTGPAQLPPSTSAKSGAGG